MNIKKKAIKGIFWSAVQNWGSQAGSLLVFFVLARLLNPEAFGLVALANVFLVFMQIFLNQGFAQVLIQRQKLEPEHLNTAFWINLGIGAVLTLAVVIAAPGIADLFQQPQLAPILRGFSPLFLITGFGNIQQALLERNLAFRAIAVRWLAGTVLGGVVGVAMAFYGAGVWSLVSQQVVHELVGTIVLWRASTWRPGHTVSWRHFQDLFNFGISIVGFNVLSFFSLHADDFLIGYFLGPVALGYYSIAYRILGVMTQLLVNAGTKVALPTFSRLQDNPEQLRQAFYTATQLTSLIAFPAFLGVVVLAPELIPLIFGAQWLPSIAVLQILALVGLVRAVSFFKDSIFIAMNKPSWTLWLGLLSMVINLISFAVAVRWGMIAVAFAYVIRSYLIFPVGQWAISRLIRVPLLVYLRQFAAPLGSALVMAITILLVKRLLADAIYPQLVLVVCTVLGTIVYGLSIRLVSPALFQRSLAIVQLALSRSNHQSA